MTDAADRSAPVRGSAPGVDVELEQSLYQKRERIYPREVHGLFARMRVLAVAALLGLFYGVPWLSWDGQQLLLFDLPARQFHVFGLHFLPQDFVYLTGMLIVAALSLFMFTALAGRLWCGYACPQTVWTEVFLWMERKIEGDRPRQMKLDRAPLSAHKVLVKGSKHAVWVLFSLWTGFTFVGYFTPITELGARFWGFDWSGWESFWVFFYGFATYGNAGWMREQVCIYMCPYARFQSAMFDRNTLIIAYDEKRGEPRGSRRRGPDPRTLGLGDCISCQMCVQACPTGIDIRDGLQYQCIACAACIDACDDVMRKVGYPTGLVRYTSLAALEGGPATGLLRPRIVVYATVLAMLCTGLAAAIVTRVPVELDVRRDRMALYRDLADGRVENVYTVKLVNKSAGDASFVLSVTGLSGIELLAERSDLLVEAGKVVSLAVAVRAPREALTALSSAITFHLSAPHQPGLATAAEARFLGPAPNR